MTTIGTTLAVTDTVTGGTILWHRDTDTLTDAIGGAYDLDYPVEDGVTIGDVLAQIDDDIAACRPTYTQEALLGIRITLPEEAE
nr:MAG TPA: hypothetical protein [Caudoviricetes sp.]